MVDLAKLKKLINIFVQNPLILLPAAMRLVNYFDEETANLSFHLFLQRILPSGSIKGLCLTAPSKASHPQHHQWH